MIRYLLMAMLTTALLSVQQRPAAAQKAPKKRVLKADRVTFQFLPAAAAARTLQAVNLLRLPKVQEELKLDGDQKKEIQEALDGYNKAQRDEYAKLRGIAADERQKKLQELQKSLLAKAKETDKSVRAVLKPEQVARLEQISLQLFGINALQQPDVIKKLKITKDQQAKFQEVQKATADKRQKLIAAVRNGTADRTKYREEVQEIQKAHEKNTLDVLTKEQQADFEKMKGKKFDFGLGLGLIRPGLRAIPLPAGKFKIRPIRVKGKVIVPVKPKAAKVKDNDKADE